MCDGDFVVFAIVKNGGSGNGGGGGGRPTIASHDLVTRVTGVAVSVGMNNQATTDASDAAISTSEFRAAAARLRDLARYPNVSHSTTRNAEEGCSNVRRTSRALKMLCGNKTTGSEINWKNFRPLW